MPPQRLEGAGCRRRRGDEGIVVLRAAQQRGAETFADLEAAVAGMDSMRGRVRR
jgi:hypothetical protein